MATAAPLDAGVWAQRLQLSGDRHQVRWQTLLAALGVPLVLAIVSTPSRAFFLSASEAPSFQ